MHLPRNFNHTRTADMAAFLVKNKTDLETALLDLADHLATTLGDTDAYSQVADMARAAANKRGWFSNDRRHDIDRMAGDLRELAGLPRHVYADTTVWDIVASAPAALRPLAARAARTELARLT